MLLIFNVGLDILLALFGLYIGHRRREREAEEKLLAEQETFFGELVGQYARCGDMLEALEESSQMCGEGLQQEAMRLVEALETDEFSEESGYYSKRAKNSYFVLFFTLCHTIRVFGDMQLQGVSLLAHNIRYIREEVRMELLRRQEGRYAFLGLTLLCILPFFFTIPIQLWNASISANLNRYYSGTYGFATLVICFLLTVICAAGVQELQYPTMPGARRDHIEKWLPAHPVLGALIDAHIAGHYSRYLKKNEALKVLQGFGNIREFLVRKLLCAAGCTACFGIILLGYAVVGGQSKAVQGGSVHMLTAALFLAAAAALGYLLPDAWVIILQARVEQQKIEETLRFETLILIVMHYSQITVEEILRWMERFSLVFSRAFQRAVDDFSYRRRETLEQLKEELAYEPAIKLVDALIVCDEISVAQAFYDLEGERAYDMDEYRKRAEAQQREKAALARVIAFLPFVTVLALRLIVPFVMEGLTQLGSY